MKFFKKEELITLCHIRGLPLHKNEIQSSPLAMVTLWSHFSPPNSQSLCSTCAGFVAGSRCTMVSQCWFWPSVLVISSAWQYLPYTHSPFTHFTQAVTECPISLITQLKYSPHRHDAWLYPWPFSPPWVVHGHLLPISLLYRISIKVLKEQELLPTHRHILLSENISQAIPGSWCLK